MHLSSLVMFRMRLPYTVHSVLKMQWVRLGLLCKFLWKELHLICPGVFELWLLPEGGCVNFFITNQLLQSNPNTIQSHSRPRHAVWTVSLTSCASAFSWLVNFTNSVLDGIPLSRYVYAQLCITDFITLSLCNVQRLPVNCGVIVNHSVTNWSQQCKYLYHCKCRCIKVQAIKSQRH